SCGSAFAGARMMRFRGRSAAASLKQGYRGRLRYGYRRFRGRSAAASLKRPDRLQDGVRRHEIPRPIGRGLIEARNTASECGCSSSIPRPIGRGLIEAKSGQPSSSLDLVIPRPIGRGLIEAVKRQDLLTPLPTLKRTPPSEVRIRTASGRRSERRPFVVLALHAQKRLLPAPASPPVAQAQV